MQSKLTEQELSELRKIRRIASLAGYIKTTCVFMLHDMRKKKWIADYTI
jgi:hypothetical protein